MPTGACVVLSANTNINGAITLLTDSWTGFALEFSKNCSIFSTVSTILDDLGLKEDLEATLTSVMDKCKEVYDQVQEAIGKFASIYEDGIALLYNWLSGAQALLQTIINNIITAVASLSQILSWAINTFILALCKTLNSSVANIPENLRNAEPALKAVSVNIDTTKPKAALSDALNKLGVNTALASITGATASLGTISTIPNLTSYVCI